VAQLGTLHTNGKGTGMGVWSGPILIRDGVLALSVTYNAAHRLLCIPNLSALSKLSARWSLGGKSGVAKLLVARV
jgi:hypothetical protein